jgi:hypothetical protein
VKDLKEKRWKKMLSTFKEYPGMIIQPTFVHTKKYYRKFCERGRASLFKQQERSHDKKWNKRSPPAGHKDCPLVL